MQISGLKGKLEDGARSHDALARINKVLNQDVALSRAVKEWSNTARRQRQLSRTTLRVVQKMLNRAQAGAFGQWTATVRKQARKRGAEERKQVLMQKVMKQMQHKGLAAALSRWQENVHELKAMAGKTRKVMMRLRHQAAASCLLAWHDDALQEKQRKLKSLRAVQKMLNRAQVGAFGRWLATAREQAMERGAEERKQVVMRRVLQRMALRMRNAGICKAYATWAENAAEAMRLKLKAKMVVRRFWNQAQAGALERWRTNVSELARQRGIMDRILRRMFKANVAAGETRPLLACLLRVLLIFAYALSL